MLAASGFLFLLASSFVFPSPSTVVPLELNGDFRGWGRFCEVGCVDAVPASCEAYGLGEASHASCEADGKTDDCACVLQKISLIVVAVSVQLCVTGHVLLGQVLVRSLRGAAAAMRRRGDADSWICR